MSVYRDILGDLNIPKFSLRIFIAAFFFNASFRLLLNHRLGKFFFNKKGKLFSLMAAYYKMKQNTKRSCDISYKANLGTGIYFPHPIGIVIGDGVEIGNKSKIYQHVTFGSHGRKGEKLQYPIVGDQATIFAGATLVGAIKIGEKAIVGANSFVNINVPKNRTAIGNPARILGV